MAKKYPQLSNNLKQLLFEKDMKAIDLAREVDMPQPTIHRLVTGKSTRPHKSSLKPIADFFSLTVEQLLGEEPLPNQKQEKPINQTAHALPINTIPIIAWQQIQNLADARQHSTRQIPAAAKVSNDIFALVMNDYSMDPLFPKLTTLIFSTEKNAVDRSYVLVKLSSQETPIFRQLLIDGEHKFLKPLNPDLNTYQMRLLNKDDKVIATLIESRIMHHADEDENLLEDIL